MNDLELGKILADLYQDKDGNYTALPSEVEAYRRGFKRAWDTQGEEIELLRQSLMERIAKHTNCNFEKSKLEEELKAHKNWSEWLSEESKAHADRILTGKMFEDK